MLHELEFGLQLLPSGQRRDGLRATLLEVIARHDDRILPVGRSAATWAARFRGEAQRSGRTLDLGDALIAGTAKASDLALATRNTADFRNLNLCVTIPWDYS